MTPWLRVSRSAPCPICQHADWCTISGDGTTACCMRIPEGAHAQAKNGGWMHKIADAPTRPIFHRRPPPRPPQIDARSIWLAWRAETPSDATEAEADRLGVGWLSWQSMGAVLTERNDTWAIPMHDGAGSICGLRLRGTDGRKLSVRGSRAGVFLPVDGVRPPDERQAGSWSGSVDAPLKTISAGGIHAALCEPFLVEYHGEKSDGEQRRVKSVDDPLPVQSTANRFGLCQPFITKYYGTGVAKPVTEPLGTVTSHDRFALVQPAGMDIRFRMLQPHELAAAMGFEGYEFSGTKTDQVRQIGNAVAVEPAEALCGSIMDAGR